MPAFAGKKRKSAGGGESSSSRYEDDKGSDGPVEKGSSKRGKGSGGTAFQPSRQPQTDADGNQYWEISKSRRVTVSDFKGKQLVNVREYYLKDDEWLPGKKGISMSIEQYSALVDIMPQIEETLARKGEKVPRPDYSGNAEPVQDDEDNDSGRAHTTKANIDTTSDEED